MSNTGPRLPDVIRTIILDYAATYQLLDWVEQYRLSPEGLAKNPRAIDLLLENPVDIRWAYMSSNPAAFYVMRDTCPKLFIWEWMAKNTNPDAIKYMIANIDLIMAEDDPCDHILNRNPCAVSWLREHPEYIDWNHLSMNPAAIDLLRANPGKIDFQYLGANPHPWAVAQVDTHPDDIWMYTICMNENGLALIKKYADPNLPYIGARGIAWVELCTRTNPEIVAYVLEHPNRIEWRAFSSNPSAFEYLEAHRYEINYAGFSENPMIFKAVQPYGVRELL